MRKMRKQKMTDQIEDPRPEERPNGHSSQSPITTVMRGAIPHPSGHTLPRVTESGMNRPARKGEGRPSKYDPEFCEVMISAMETEGLSLGAVAGLIGVSRDTLYEWTTVHPEFSGAKKIGEAKAQLFWERKNVSLANNGSAGPGASTAIVFALKNRAKADWRDVIEQKHTGDANNPIAIENVTARELVTSRIAGLASRIGTGFDTGGTECQQQSPPTHHHPT
jgi:transposase-like protein